MELFLLTLKTLTLKSRMNHTNATVLFPNRIQQSFIYMEEYAIIIGISNKFIKELNRVWDPSQMKLPGEKEYCDDIQ